MVDVDDLTIFNSIIPFHPAVFFSYTQFFPFWLRLCCAVIFVFVVERINHKELKDHSAAKAATKWV